MFKLVVLSVLAALAAAAPAPGILSTYPVAYSAAIVGHAPTTISHQSSSVVHSAAIATPVVHAAPIVHSASLLHAAPVVAAPLLHSAPLISSYAAAPLLSHGLHY